MYFVALAGRNYNIAIRTTAAIGGRLAVFSSRLESCNGPLEPVSCDVDIAYYYEDVALNSGYRSITLFSASSQVSEQPTGEILTTLYISSLTGSGCTAYNQVYDCPGPLPTTTTTTTTSTTSTTTTVSPASYSEPIIKYDQYSSSFGPGGVPIWPNIGSGGSTYDMDPGTNSSITALGTGVSQYLRMNGGFIDTGGEVQALSSALTGPFPSLYNKSFSYAIVFRVQNPTTSAGYISSIDAIQRFDGELSYYYIGQQVFLYNTLPSTSTGNTPKIYTGISQFDGDVADGNKAISTTSKWYLSVLTFDKNASYTTALKHYLNLSGGSIGFENEWIPSTFFESTNETNHNLGARVLDVDIAAVIFWENTVLTINQIQTLYNEYNSRYTLG